MSNLNKISVLSIIVLVCIVCHVSFLLFNLSAAYHPVWSDELLYVVNAKAYTQHHTLHAAFTYKGTGSIFLGADAHGFGYPLIHGLIANIIGWNTLNFIGFNFISVALALLCVVSLKSISNHQKILTITLCVLFPFFHWYAYSFMQEAIHVALAILLSVLLHQISQNQNRQVCITCFIALIMVASVLRMLWFFWLIALIPFAENKKQSYTFILIFVAGCIMAYFFNLWIYEPLPNYFASLVSLIKQGAVLQVVSSVIIHVTDNLKHYFLDTNHSMVYFAVKYINFLSVVYFARLAFQQKQKIHQSIAMVGAVNFALLLLLYDATQWKEIRTMAALCYFSVLFFVIYASALLRYAVLMAFIPLYYFSAKISHNWIHHRNAALPHQQQVSQSFSKMAKVLQSPATILVKSLPYNNEQYLYLLPLSTENKQPLHYVLPYYGTQDAQYQYTIESKLKDAETSMLQDSLIVLKPLH